MSVLNQMLRDLEKRGAMPDVVAAAGTATVARPALALPAPAFNTRRRWIWASVLAIAAGFVAVHTWLSYRVQDAGVARLPLGARQFAGVASTGAPAQSTAIQAAPSQDAPVQGATVQAAPAQSVLAQAPAVPATPTQSVPAQTPAVQAAPVAPARAAASTPDPAEAVRARGRESAQDNTPARATPQVATALPRATPKTAAPRAPTARQVAQNDGAPSAAPLAAQTPDAQVAAAIVRASNTVAADVDRAADLIARGRATEAMDLLVRVLARQPAHAGARSSLAALLAEAGRREQALHVLLAGSEIDPLRFAAPAAQLQAEMGDLSGALATLGRIARTARTPGLEALHAGLAQRAGDHMTAIAAYRRALAQPQADPVWWVGLGVSLEATGEPAEARDAYARAAAQARLSTDVRRYVSERLSALTTQGQRNDEARKAALANVY